VEGAVGVVVVIADRDPKRMELVRRLVELEAAQALPAASARDAMVLFARREPELTLIQIERADDPGLDLCRDMKRIATAHHCPVVVIGPSETRSSAFAAGCYAFVVRHADDESLIRTIRRLLAGRRRAHPTAPLAVSP
jgi:DNA-binding NarL/FixJ family response regulator